MSEFGASDAYTVYTACVPLLAFKDPLGTVTDAFNLNMALLNHVFH